MAIKFTDGDRNYVDISHLNKKEQNAVTFVPESPKLHEMFYIKDIEGNDPWEKIRVIVSKNNIPSELGKKIKSVVFIEEPDLVMLKERSTVKDIKNHCLACSTINNGKKCAVVVTDYDQQYVYPNEEIQDGTDQHIWAIPAFLIMQNEFNEMVNSGKLKMI